MNGEQRGNIAAHVSEILAERDFTGAEIRTRLAEDFRIDVGIGDLYDVIGHLIRSDHIRFDKDRAVWTTRGVTDQEIEYEILSALHDGGMAATVIQGRLAVAFGIRIEIPALVERLEAMFDQGLLRKAHGAYGVVSWSPVNP